MSKVSGSYKSLSRGVSQQVPELRLDGQHSEQVNLLSDPVQGLARRRGSDMLLESRVITGAVLEATRTDAKQFVSRPFSVGTGDYSLLYRTGAKTASSQLPNLMVYNKVSKANVPVVTAGGDANVATMLAAGISGVTQVGRYVIMASKGWVLPATTADVWSPSTNARYGAVWIRGGAYSRTYKITISRAAVADVVVSYTTPSSSYPGVLDTSDIAASDPEYQKKVNDRVNAYNGAVTLWLGTANAAIQPSAIAAQLTALINAAIAGSATQIDSHIGIDCNSPLLTSIRAEDSGDNTLIRAVHQEVKLAAQVTTIHRVGKVIKVQANENDPAYYLEAEPEQPGATGFQKVTWVEAARETFTAGTWFLTGTVEAGSFYVASTPALLRSLVPALTLPDIEGRAVGDPDTNKAPFFVGRSLDYLGYFQDRLVLGSGGVIQTSEVGNYFNFFRTSVLTVVDKDPVELFALGGEDDIVRHSVIFDKSLLLFGDEQQYSISGRVPLTPATSSVVQSSAHEGATDARPVAAGELVFYTKRREGFTQAHQIRIGQVDDTSNSNEITQQLGTYIPGVPVEVIAGTSPDTVVIRTDANYTHLYVYRYLDKSGNQERLLDSWSRFEYSAACGTLVGITMYKSQMLLHWLREGVDKDGVAGMWLVVDSQSFLANLDSKPYLDSARRYDTIVAAGSNNIWHPATLGVSTAYDNTSTAYLQGEDTLSAVPAMIAEFPAAASSKLVSGIAFTAYVDLTNPVVRDRNDVAIVSGRLTITSIVVSYSQTGGLLGAVTTAYSSDTVLDFNGRVLGAQNNLVGVQPVSKGSTPVLIGRETREFVVRLSSKTWLPLTLTGLEWTGQFFYHPRRV